MNRTEKAQVIEELNQKFRENPNVLLINFAGVNVADVTELRRKISESGSAYRVIKNTLALRAAENTPVEQIKDHFQGPTAVAYTDQDPIALAKILTDFVKSHPQSSFKAGVLSDAVISSEQIRELAELPSREELLSKLLFLLNAPLTRLALALQSPVRNLAVVLNQLEGAGKEEKE